MKILFIAHSYLNLYKEIEKELISQGHDVVTILDPNICTYAWAKQKLPLRLRIKKYLAHKNNVFDKYWSNRCKGDAKLNQSYDLLFVIQGLSFSPILLDYLRIFNPNIRSSLYIWDSNLTLDFFHNIPFFDKIYSFDWYDVQQCSSNKLKFLPFFWPKEIENYDNENIIYDISSIGSSHDGRLQIFKKLNNQFECKSINAKLQLYIPTQGNLTMKDKIKLLLLKIKGRGNEELENLLISKGLRYYPFVIHELYSPEEMNIMMARSKSILDTDRELQFGTTPRLIWALAANKHIFTTNSKVVNLPFYNEDYIHIIDRNNPVIDFSLLDVETDDLPRQSIEYLRIDNWIKNFL